MKASVYPLLILLGIAAALLVTALSLGSRLEADQDSPAGSGIPRHTFDRVFIVVLENTNSDQALRQPFLRRFASMGALFANFHGVTHPSYPNYLAMAAGSTFGIDHDATQDLDATNLVDLLEAARISWRVYAENLPSPCFRGTNSPDGLYVRRHEPYISFRNVQDTPARCNQIVNAPQLQTDLAKDALPGYGLYIPNVRNDGHDTGVTYADAWLKDFLTPLLEESRFMRGTLVVVTFDESGHAWGNPIYTAFVGRMVTPGATSDTRYDHFSLLRTIEDNFGLGSLSREDAKATAICCVWNNPGARR